MTCNITEILSDRDSALLPQLRRQLATERIYIVLGSGGAFEKIEQKTLFVLRKLKTLVREQVGEGQMSLRLALN